MKQKYLVLTQYSYDHSEEVNGRYEVLDAVSLTEPSQSLTIKDIISRMAMGYIEPSYDPGSFDGDPRFEDLSPLDEPNFDLADADDLRQSYKQEQYRRSQLKPREQELPPTDVPPEKAPPRSESKIVTDA